VNIRLTHLDGKLPNIALMKTAAHHRAQGDEVYFTRSVQRGMFEPIYDRVYGSAIFSFSAPRVALFRHEFPEAIVGGTWNPAEPMTVEDRLGLPEDAPLDYSDYRNFTGSIGFTQRGCRLKCGFCVVPKKEGKNRSINTIVSIWRAPPWPKHLHLLDNDFFGQPREQWEARIGEIIDGGFRVCLNQGINIRMIDDDSAKALASILHYNDSFTERIVYTAWDNIGDEERFFRGVRLLEKYGVPPHRLRVYMLVGYDKRETWERVLYRFNRMAELLIRPYPMIYGDREQRLPLGGCNQKIAHRTLAEFQRWVIRRAYAMGPFEDYDSRGRAMKSAAVRDQLSLGLVA
jgi:hypothetical protein